MSGYCEIARLTWKGRATQVPGSKAKRPIVVTLKNDDGESQTRNFGVTEEKSFLEESESKLTKPERLESQESLTPAPGWP
jgi:hypothetical protein